MSSSLKTTVIGLGGAGSNIVNDIKQYMGDEPFIEYMTVDSSDANVKEGIPFHHIKRNTVDGKVLTGTGGVRGEHMEDLTVGVKNFIDKQKLHKHDGVIYLVFSTSGGTGNMLAKDILTELLPHGVIICCLIVHDTTNQQYAFNSKKATETIFNVANKNNHALPVIYYTNSNTLTIVNKSIAEEFKNIMKFHDTENITEIDIMDMKNFYNPKRYTQFVTPPGIYSVANIKPEQAPIVLEKHPVVIGRALTNDDIDPLKDKGLKHNKKGMSKDETENVILLLNNFDKQYSLLKKALEIYATEVVKHEIDVDDNDGVVL